MRNSVVVEACREWVYRKCVSAAAVTTRRRSNVCESTVGHRDLVRSVCGKKETLRASSCRRCRRICTEVRKEAKCIWYFCSNNPTGVIIIWSAVGGASRSSGFVLSRESVPVRAAQHISTLQRSSFARPKPHRRRGKLNWSGHYNNTAFYI